MAKTGRRVPERETLRRIETINSIVGNGKRFMAYDLVRRLKEAGYEDVLSQLKSFVNATDRSRSKVHEVFEPSFDWKECRSNRFIEQKLNYIHNNPCQPHWGLASSPGDYWHSSAGFYETGDQGLYEVTSYCELEDIDLTGKI